MAYNAEMGASNFDPETEITAWLRAGGLVVTASERAARSITAGFHRARRAEGLSAWPAPTILDWQTFLRAAWKDRSSNDARLLLDPLQEQSIWAGIAGSEQQMVALLEGPRNRMANLAMEAHQLLCSYVPQLLKQKARAAWQQDAENFSAWLSAFEETCRANNLLSPARLPLELIPLLESATTDRPPLLLAGFDRILPTQRRLFDAWGKSKEAVTGEPNRDIRFYSAADSQSELIACALWCKHQLAANPNANLLVLTQNLSTRRGDIERAFLNFAAEQISPPSAAPLFEFSLGIPLGQVALARGAHLLLRWLSSPLAEHELDWLLSTGQIGAGLQESIALQSSMRTLRHRGLERTNWTLNAFLAQPPHTSLPPAWVSRITEAQSQLAQHARLPKSPLDWAEVVPKLLETAGWPGHRTPSSIEFQALRLWHRTVESCSSLGFDGRRIRWPEFLSTLAHALDETLFAPESRDAPIQIAGPAESAGLTADAIWFMGASEVDWPYSGTTHPLLPPEVQREAAMPHATAQLDWELARAITIRLLRSAPHVCFSYARQSEGVETRPSRLIAQLAGAPQPVPEELTAPAPPDPLTVSFEDSSRVPFPPGKVEGGAGVLTHESQCPFKAFATARLAAQSWQPAEPGLTAAQRGNLLHAVLHAVWAGPPHGIRTLNDLQALSDRPAFVKNHVTRALQQKLHSSLRDRMPRRYLELEEQRLTRLVAEWLNYESTRIEFEVTATEVDSNPFIAGLSLDLRLDRIDRLNDGRLLVVDYKTGDISPKSWDLPRPDDVQLPQYACFAIDSNLRKKLAKKSGEEAEEVEYAWLAGLAFAKVRTGKMEFAGRVFDAKATLLSGLRGNTNLVKNPLTFETLFAWKENIQQIAKDFVAGYAEVSPREYPKTCERCGLQASCRIEEQEGPSSAPDVTEDEGAPNE